MIGGLDPGVLAAVLAAAFATSVVHGATGIGGGFLMAIVLAPLIGVGAVVPVLAVALTISGVARVALNRDALHARAFWRVEMAALPAVIAGALIYGILPSSAVAVLLGLTILTSVPLRRWAARRSIEAGPRALTAAGGVYGLISGASIGAGMLLIPFLLGHGLTRRQFVGTLAAIALAMNATRTVVFGASDLLSGGWWQLGLACGIMTLPGNWVGQRILRGMGEGWHGRAIDLLTVFGGLNFLRIAWTG